jgi:hypothetical protein
MSPDLDAGSARPDARQRHAYPPAELDCRMESVCETCAYFRTGSEFVPVLLRQRDHARKHGQNERADLFEDLVNRVSEASGRDARCYPALVTCRDIYLCPVIRVIATHNDGVIDGQQEWPLVVPQSQ